MKIEKLPSGSYRIRKMHKGKSYQVTFDHKPTQREALEEISKLINSNTVDCAKLTFYEACREYINIKSNILSPSTLRGYISLTEHYSTIFKSKLISEITQSDITKEINNYASSHSPKTVANYHGFLNAVITEFRPDMQIYTKLPQKKSNTEGYIPSIEDIQRLLKHIEGTPHELGIKLAVCGLRRSEICALEPNDLDDNNILHINKAYIRGSKDWIVKDTNKTDAGTRDILLPTEYAELFRQAKPNKLNHVYRYMPDTLYKSLLRYEKEIGLPYFKLHACRHFYCSLLHSQGVSDAVIQKLGGWKSAYTMQKIYRHALDQDKQDAMNKISDVISNL